MNNLDSIISIEKEKSKELQSNMHKLINNLVIFKDNLNSENLSDLILLNQKINELSNMIQKTERNVLHNNKNNLSKLNKKRLKEYDNFDKIIKKFLPYMLMECMNTSEDE